MEYRSESVNKQIKQNSLSDPKEVERLLMQYAGVFKKNIKEYAERVIRKKAKQKNYAR